MSPIRERHYDEVFDAQRHYRLLLDSMARPGQIREFTGLTLTPPAPFSPAAAAMALALLDTNVSFACVGYGEDTAAYLRANTSAREAAVDAADFVFFAHGAAHPETISMAKVGVPAYPEQGATLVFEVAALETVVPDAAMQTGSVNGSGGAMRLTLSGPGVDGTITFKVRGLVPGSIEAVRRLNREYPLGVELILVTGTRFVSIPRSSAVAGE